MSSSIHNKVLSKKANILVIRFGLPPWVGILRNLDPTNIVWGIWGIRVENSNLIRHSLNARQTITKTNKRHIDFGMSREHPPTLKSSSRANFHKVWRSLQTLLFTHSYFTHSHFTRSHFTHSHFTRSHFTHSHFTRSHEKIEETLFLWHVTPLSFSSPEWLFDAIVPFLERKITSLYKYNTLLHTSLHK